MDKAKIDIESLTVSRILVVVAHPDDIESWCAGTICRFVDVGKHVCYVLCTSGDKGTSDPTLTLQQVAEIREAEQIEAARILGVDCVTFLRRPDSEVEATLALRRELVRQIRFHRPHLVITHDPVPPYRLHPDHRAVVLELRDGSITMYANQLLNLLVALVCAPFLLTVINRTKAFFAGRRGLLPKST